jgi:hypothetical protein
VDLRGVDINAAVFSLRFVDFILSVMMAGIPTLCQKVQYARDAVLTIEPDSRVMNLFYVALGKRSGKSTDIEYAFHGGGDTSS